jgi:hypothetical protein
MALISSVASGGETRWARVSELNGSVEVQITAADPWQPAARNLPLPELAWVRTGAGSHVELELEDGSAVRLTSDSLLELSDYTRLSTGQRITLLSLDRGLAYFTGQAKGRDALILAVPGAQLTVSEGIRVRIEAGEAASQIAMIEGAATFSSPAAELVIREGQTVKVEPANASRFALYREVTPLESDRWNQERDQALASSSAAAHLPDLHYGLDDLDAHGAWIATDEHGTAWKPEGEQGWAPFRNGRWSWYPEIGFTWISSDPWGWLPYHYGRWARSEAHGWLWVPGELRVFKPGDAYWLTAADIAGWGPLAPGEVWNAGAVPRLYLHAHTTYAKLVADAREFDPGALQRPRESLSKAVFAAAPPSPPLAASRLDAQRPVLRAGSTRVIPLLAGVAYEQGPAVQQAAAPPELTPSMTPPPVAQPAPAAAEPDYPPAPAQTTVVVPVPVETPVYYPAPVYTGIIVVNPPEKKKPQERPRPRHPERREERAAEPPRPAPPAPPPAQAIRRVSRDEAPREDRRAEPRREEPKAEEAPKAEEQPIPRDTNDAGRSRRQR